MTTLVLPWPNRKLSPNSRGDWRAKNSPRQVAFTEGYAAGAEMRSNATRQDWFEMTVTFCRPVNRRYDLDNLLASLKPTIDGIFASWGLDDNQVQRIVLQWGETMKGGRVVMEFRVM